ncbi:MAG: hypothetical protein COY66_03050 [Candidatus Kerfeldbacteria bacterium CG_4_10_14_0_8_um_filter_42_10]|uniref:Uncharacterized protein n=1 Tax=Candidatus Kerfeldbacteria bacterium CG_4_10_14_0_8_um_filter_42_10 TaxID=2014248 RepID=A0A2M7RK89_9BACT|nr:MAG: hypothetical protein COY66_03050 [Candidatus Kerfeldbacteria bacterium CG_4_10_14_0_8_um_filter_42_10]
MIFATVAANTGTWIANFDWSKPTWDMFIILFFVVAALLYGMSLGRDRIIVILVSIYMALAVVNTAPYINDVNTEVGINQFFVVRITAFVAIFVFLFFLLSRSALLATVASSDDRGKWWQVIVFSILHVGLLISITLSFLPESAAGHLAPSTQTIFVSEVGRFIWIVAPILLMILLKGGASNKKKFKYDI